MATLLSEVVRISREKANTDSNGLTDTKALDFSNEVLVRSRKMLIERGIDAAPQKETLLSIVDGGTAISYPGDMFYIPKFMELNWWDTSKQNLWRPIDKVEESNLPQGVSLSWLRINQPSDNPLVDFKGEIFEIYPTPNANTWGGASGSTYANSLRIVYPVQPVLYGALTSALAYYESLDYFAYANLIKDTYLNVNGQLTDAELDKSYENYIGKIIKIVQGEGQMPTRAKGLGITGWQY